MPVNPSTGTVKRMTAKMSEFIEDAKPVEADDDGIRRINPKGESGGADDADGFDEKATHARISGFLETVDRDPKKSKHRVQVGARLLLGDLDHAIEIAEVKAQAVGVVGVVNMYMGKESEKYIKPMYTKIGVEYLGINAEDEEGYPVLVNHADEVIAWIKQLPAGRVMVHCREGKNRSGAMAAAWLMAEEGMEVEEAVRHIIGNRNICLSNKSFVKQLCAFAAKLKAAKN